MQTPIIVEVSKGRAFLRPYIDRRTAREYNSALYKNVAMFEPTSDGRSPLESVDYESIERANDVLVRSIVTRFEPKTGEPIEVIDQSFVDTLTTEDFSVLIEKCREIRNGGRDEESKKNSSTGSEPQS